MTDLRIAFPVAPRLLLDSLMPKTLRWYPEWTWALMDDEGGIWGTAGVFDHGWFVEFGSLWVHEKFRSQGWGRQLTEARLEYVRANQARLPSLILSRPPSEFSWKNLSRLGFKDSEILDGDGDPVMFLRITEEAG